MYHQQPGVYRNQLSSLRQLHHELWVQRSAELLEVSPQLRSIYARRVARTTAGIAAFVAMTLLFLGSAGMMVYFAFDIPRHLATGIGAATLGVWGLSLATYAGAYRLAMRDFDRRMMMRAGPDLHASISFLSRFDPRGVAIAAVARWEHRAIMWPLMGFAMVAPLLIHYLTASLLIGQLAALDEFGLWVGLAALVVGHVHYFVGAQGASFARDVVETSDDRLPLLRGRGWRALVVGVGASLMPGLAALGIPCLVVALTGLVFLPASYWAMHVVSIRERDALAAAAGSAPASV